MIAPQIGELAPKFEAAQESIIRNEALATVQQEYPKYFEALRKHPRTLVGQEVPSLKGDGSMERLRDSADAADWQEGVKQQLVAAIDEKVTQQLESLAPALTAVHESIQLFQNNPDLIPRATGFDKELADAFASAAKAYEVRQDGKLIGYSVPVQPVINALRTQLQATRAAKATPPAAPATPTPQQQRAAEQPRTPTGQWDGPQAGLTSKAGTSGTGADDLAGGVLNAFLRQNGVTI